MNDSMTSVADIPDDADDDLPEISPELVLVDPELARIMRKRVPATPGADRLLRLVPTIESAREESGETRHPPAPRHDAGDILEKGVPREEPEPIVPRAVAPEIPRTPSPALHAPVPEPRPDPTVEPPRAEAAPLPSAPDVAQQTADRASAMPHAIARPDARPAVPAARRKRGRGVVGLLMGISAASVATLGILNLSGGAFPVASETGRGPIPPAASKPRPSTGEARPARKTAPVAKTRSTTTRVPANVPRVVRWAPVRGAVAYRVQLFRNGRPVLGVRTTRTALDLNRLLRARNLTLAPGSYGWSVQPISGRGKSR